MCSAASISYTDLVNFFTLDSEESRSHYIVNTNKHTFKSVLELWEWFMWPGPLWTHKYYSIASSGVYGLDLAFLVPRGVCSLLYTN